MAGTWNRARDHWVAQVYALGMDLILSELCPGKVLCLIAADVVAWHYHTGGKLNPNTEIWRELPLPWEVLTGKVRCSRQHVEETCQRNGLDSEQSGWTASRPRTTAVPFRATPELVHGITVSNPYLATFLPKAGVFSGKHLKPSHFA